MLPFEPPKSVPLANFCDFLNNAIRPVKKEIGQMLFPFMFLSALIALLAVGIVGTGEMPYARFAMLLGMILLCGVTHVFPVGFGFSMFTLIATLIWCGTRSRVRTFYFALAVCFCATYGVAGWNALEHVKRLDSLKVQFPTTALESRLPIRLRQGEVATPPNPLNLDELENRVARHFQLGWQNRDRNEMLQELHRSKLEQFIDAPDFGMMRMRHRDVPSEQNLRPIKNEPVPAQAASEPKPAWSPTEAGPSTKLDDHLSERFKALHRSGVVDFVNPEGFGYMPDSDHVAGFEAHRFSKRSTQLDDLSWNVARVYLVGLVVHPEPVVYLTDTLPTMEKVKDTPTRELDAFEIAGVAALRSGEDYFHRGDDKQLRLLGSIRATKQCCECHGCQRGQLLGAFSYYLVSK